MIVEIIIYIITALSLIGVSYEINTLKNDMEEIRKIILITNEKEDSILRRINIDHNLDVD